MDKLQGSCGQVRKSDVKITVDLDTNGIEIIIISKFDKMFGTHMEEAVKEVLAEQDIKDAKIVIEDDGALDFTIKARTRTALKRIHEVLK